MQRVNTNHSNAAGQVTNFEIVATFPSAQERRSKLLNELKYAIANTPKEELMGWGKHSAGLFLANLGNRAVGLVKVASSLVGHVRKETSTAVHAFFENRFKQHIVDRGQAALHSVDRIIHNLIDKCSLIAEQLKKDPREAAPELLMIALGFGLGSGGLDGNGGIPDTDLLAGIGHHRSIFTHSIVSGAAIQTVACSLILLVGITHSHLPSEHDHFWDKLLAAHQKLSVALAKGACAGIAYHLFVDATIDSGKAYSDLPVSAPMRIHNGIMGASAAAEAINLKRKF